MSKRKSKKQKQKELRAKIFLVLCVLFIVAILIFGKDKVLDTIERGVNYVASVAEEILGTETDTGNKNVQKAQELSTKDARGVAGTGVQVADTLFLPQCSGGDDHEHRDFLGYSICYREQYEQAEWSATVLTRENLQNKVAERTDDFRADPQIATGSATPDDYKRSGYDRGHLVPAADMAWSEQAMSESFFMSNMSPQAPSFNRGIWNKLEGKVRDYAKKFGTVYTVSGPILEKTTYATIGENNVAVPEFYYKVILAHTDTDEWSAIGFIFPNEGSDASYFDYAVAVDEIEARCNIDFFYQLPDELENALESTVNLGFWQ